LTACKKQTTTLLVYYTITCNHDNIIKDQEQRSFTERVVDDGENTHYLLHYPVKKDSITTPTKIDKIQLSGYAVACNDCSGRALLAILTTYAF